MKQSPPTLPPALSRWLGTLYELAEYATGEALTPAEVAVLQFIAAGNANRQIAAQLNINEETVKGPGQKYPLQIGRK